MDIYKALSVLGALAWLPPVISYFIKLYMKPKLTLIVHPQIEIGYTYNGSILNYDLAISAENKECLVTNIQTIIEGPNREEHRLDWQWFEEKLYEIDYNNEIGSTPVRKKQNAIAIKILKEYLVEKRVGFHEASFKEKYQEAIDATNQKFELIIRNSQDPESVKLTTEYDKFKNLLESSLIWKEGNYKAKVLVKALNVKETFNTEFHFRLSTNDVKKLQSNTDFAIKVLEQAYIPKEGFNVFWNWINPNINLAK
ncbi:hypothetical protein [uncultured Mucilaginibacter sp.]|uniref:hypothetical protein n=1 Tax=uncultured Mucilaginibacter sp. TaxID=797541 RepID=UPI002619A74F|nr:hypothetical protein [uncultured Mucilaginibacter sp.]